MNPPYKYKDCLCEAFHLLNTKLAFEYSWHWCIWRNSTNYINTPGLFILTLSMNFSLNNTTATYGDPHTFLRFQSNILTKIRESHTVEGLAMLLQVKINDSSRVAMPVSLPNHPTHFKLNFYLLLASFKEYFCQKLFPLSTLILPLSETAWWLLVSLGIDMEIIGPVRFRWKLLVRVFSLETKISIKLKHISFFPSHMW